MLLKEIRAIAGETLVLSPHDQDAEHANTSWLGAPPHERMGMSADEVVTRWVETGCTVVRLSPVDDATVAAPDLPAESAAAEPRETPARVEVRRPFRLHKVRRR